MGKGGVRSSSASVRCVIWASALALTGCLDADAGPDRGNTGQLAIDVAPLSLSGLTNARYTITVRNAAGGGGEIVWARTLDSTAYGDGAGSLSYVGTCDADAGVNTVILEIVALYDANGQLAAGSFADPTPVSREITCVEGTDVAVSFDLAIARRAEQGFFDIAVSFEDLFCSAKLDCLDDEGGGDLELLHNPDGGARELTAVVGFACTSAVAGPTWLYMDDPVISCANFADVVVGAGELGTVDLTAAPNANDDDYLFAAAVYRGVEGLAAKAYWTLAFGLDADRFGAAGACSLTLRATAASTAFPLEDDGFPLPADSVYPVIDWSAPLSDSGRICGSHAVDDGGGEVETHYVGYLSAPNQFTWGDAPIYLRHRFGNDGTLVSRPYITCSQGCEHGTCVAADSCSCEAGWSGSACDVPTCSDTCQNGGDCVAPDTCDCDGTGFGGPTCDAAVCGPACLYTGDTQAFIVPAGCAQLEIKAWGAGGGRGAAGAGGGGGFATGVISVTPGESLEVLVGGGGIHLANSSMVSQYNSGSLTVYNALPPAQSAGNINGGTGAGSSEVWRGTTQLLVAGAGGGATGSTPGYGGEGNGAGSLPGGADGQSANPTNGLGGSSLVPVGGSAIGAVDDLPGNTADADYQAYKVYNGNHWTGEGHWNFNTAPFKAGDGLVVLSCVP